MIITYLQPGDIVILQENYELFRQRNPYEFVYMIKHGDIGLIMSEKHKGGGYRILIHDMLLWAADVAIARRIRS